MLRNRSMPHDVLIPVLGYPDVTEAVERLGAAYGFRLRWIVGDHRAQLAVGRSAAVAIVPGPPGVGADHIMVRVDDLPSHRERALADGAEGIRDR